MTSGELARKVNVTLRTIRFYEEKGILKPDAVSPGGQKTYGPDSLLTMQTVKLLREAGMSLAEILNTIYTLSQYETKRKSCQQAHAVLLDEARMSVTARIQELDNLKVALDRALENKDNCSACGAADCLGCTIFDTWTRFGLERPSEEKR